MVCTVQTGYPRYLSYKSSVSCVAEGLSAFKGKVLQTRDLRKIAKIFEFQTGDTILLSLRMLYVPIQNFFGLFQKA